MKQAKPRQLIPVGRTDALTARQQARIQAYVVASRLIPSGDRKAHNVQLLADWIMGTERGR